MSNLVRSIYISRANFEPRIDAVGHEPTLFDIIRTSRKNNLHDRIGGVLFFGDGHFCQCLEGEKAPVEHLLETIERDPRHERMRIISSESVSHRLFDDWSMKYAVINDEIRAFLRTYGYEQFDPYQFQPHQFNTLIHTLRETEGVR